MSMPFWQRSVPTLSNPDQYRDRIVITRRGDAVVVGWKLVLDNRPGHGHLLRHLYYGQLLPSGMKFQTFNPRLLRAREIVRAFLRPYR